MEASRFELIPYTLDLDGMFQASSNFAFLLQKPILDGGETCD